MEFATSLKILFLKTYVLVLITASVLAQENSGSHQNLNPSLTWLESFSAPVHSTVFARAMQSSYGALESRTFTTHIDLESSYASQKNEELTTPVYHFSTTRVKSELEISDYSDILPEVFPSSSTVQTIFNTRNILRESLASYESAYSTQRTEHQTLTMQLILPSSEQYFNSDQHQQTDNVASVGTSSDLTSFRTADHSNNFQSVLTFSSSLFTPGSSNIFLASSGDFNSQTGNSVFNVLLQTTADMTVPLSTSMDLSSRISISDTSSVYPSIASIENSFIEPSMSIVFVETQTLVASFLSPSLQSSVPVLSSESSYSISTPAVSSLDVIFATPQSVLRSTQNSSFETLPSGDETETLLGITQQATNVIVPDSIFLTPDSSIPQGVLSETHSISSHDGYPTQMPMCSDCEQAASSQFTSPTPTLVTATLPMPALISETLSLTMYVESDTSTYLFPSADLSMDASTFTQIYIQESSSFSITFDEYSSTTDSGSVLTFATEDVTNYPGSTHPFEQITLTASTELSGNSTSMSSFYKWSIMATYSTPLSDPIFDSGFMDTKGFSTDDITASLSRGLESMHFNTNQLIHGFSSSLTPPRHISPTSVYQTMAMSYLTPGPEHISSLSPSVEHTKTSRHTESSYETERYTTMVRGTTSSVMVSTTTTTPAVVTSRTDVIVTFTFVGDCDKLSEPRLTENFNRKFLNFIVNKTHILDKGSISIKRIHCDPNWIPVTFHKVERKRLLFNLNSTFSASPKGVYVRMTVDKENVSVNLVSFRELLDKPLPALKSKLLKADVAVIATASCICVILVAVGLFVFIREMYCKKVSERFNFNDSPTIPLKTESVALASLPKHTSVYNDLEMAEERSVDIDGTYNNSYDPDYSTVGTHRRTSFNDGTKSDLNIKTDEEDGLSSPENERHSSSNLLKRKGKKPESEDDTSKLTSEKSERKPSRGYGLVIGLMGYNEKKQQKDNEQHLEEDNNCYAVPKKVKKGIKNAAATPQTPPSEHLPSPATITKSPVIDSPIPPARRLRDAPGVKGVTDSYENLLPSESNSTTVKDSSKVSDAAGVDNPSFVAEKKDGITGSTESFHF